MYIEISDGIIIVACLTVVAVTLIKQLIKR